MKLLEEKILAEGRAMGEDILKVDSFINHQVDPLLMKQVGEEFAEHFRDKGITKVVTIESSGIAPALTTAIAMQIPMVILKKEPSKILNKPAKLNVKEREIMNIHSTLGYELLKTQNLSPKTLELIRYHHQNLQHSGYPAIETTISSDIAVQIVSISDKYSALREARVYRRRLNRLESLLILYKEVREGKILPEIYNALVKYATNFDK